METSYFRGVQIVLYLYYVRALRLPRLYPSLAFGCVVINVLGFLPSHCRLQLCPTVDIRVDRAECHVELVSPRDILCRMPSQAATGCNIVPVRVSTGGVGDDGYSDDVGTI